MDLTAVVKYGKKTFVTYYIPKKDVNKTSLALKYYYFLG
jgi:hypothetical protein